MIPVSHSSCLDDHKAALLPAALEPLIRSLRLHQDPGANLQRIMEAGMSAVSMQCLLWAPPEIKAKIEILGPPCLRGNDARRLIDALSEEMHTQPGMPYMCNSLASTNWGPSFPRIANLLAFPVMDQAMVGWLVALNRQGPANGEPPSSRRSGEAPLPSQSATPFTSGDVSVLAPIVALWEMHLRAFARYRDVKDLLVGLTKSLTAALDAKDNFTYGHSERVARIAVELGKELGLSADELSDLYLVGLLHDVGNLGIRDSVLEKPDRLTAEEFEHVKQHVTIGYSILSDLGPIRHLLPGILYHHENMDGSGYPDGLAGEAIPLMARILAVAEACDALSNKRPYRNALAFRRVEEVLVEGQDKQWDKKVVEAFQRCRHRIHAIRQRGVGHSLDVALDHALGEAQKRKRDMPGLNEGFEMATR